jgi:ATPase family associated with various cellular activities (AAA)
MYATTLNGGGAASSALGGGGGQDNAMMLMMVMSAMSRGDTASVSTMVQNHLMMMVMAQVNKINVPQVIDAAYQKLLRFLGDKFAALKANPNQKSDDSNRVHVRTMSRTWNSDSPMDCLCKTAEAVVWYIMEKYPEHIVLAKYVRGVRIPMEMTPIKISNDELEVAMTVNEGTNNNTAITATVTITCRSGTDKLNAFVKECKDAYDERQRDKFDGNLYIIDMVQPKSRRNYYSDSDPASVYDARPFESTRRINHVFLEPSVRQDLLTMVQRFEHEKEFYLRRGMPHRLGIMLYGPPGTGKTSTIKALAMSCRRHPFIIRLPQVQSAEHLRNVFMNPTVTLTINGKDAQTVDIPISRRLYVIEDVDGAGCDALLDRGLLERRAQVVYEQELQAYNQRKQQWEEEQRALADAAAKDGHDKNSSADDETTDKTISYNSDEDDDDDGPQPMKKKRKIPATYADVEKPPQRPIKVGKGLLNFTLADFLNVIDGIDEVPGRMMIMTSNHPENLDPAVMRPGRVDVKLKLGPMCRASIMEMLDCYFPGEPSSSVADLPDCVLAPCQVSNAATCSLNRADAERRIRELAAPRV